MPQRAVRSLFVMVFVVFLVFLAAAGAVRPAQAQGVRQVTSVPGDEFWYYGIGITDDGTQVLVAGNGNFFGANPEHQWQIFRFDALGQGGTRVTSFAQGVAPGTGYDGVSVSDDGEWILVPSLGDPLGTNHDRSLEVFVVDRNGAPVRQVTNDPGPGAESTLHARLSGNGARIVLLTSSDLAGLNPGRVPTLFAVDRNGGNPVRLLARTDGASFDGAEISDDGSRIVFAYSGDPLGTNADASFEIFAIESTGANLRQLTDNVDSSVSSQAVISGNGQKVAFTSNGVFGTLNPQGRTEIFALNWNGTGLRKLTTSTKPMGGTGSCGLPSITDDGTLVYFISDQGTSTRNPDVNVEIWKVKTDGTGLALLTNTNQWDGRAAVPVVAGGGTRVAFTFVGTLSAVYSNPDDSPELVTMEGSGGNKTRLTDLRQVNQAGGTIARNGSTIVFSRPPGTDAPSGYTAHELYRVKPDGTGLTPITSVTGAYHPALAGDNWTIVFEAGGIRRVNVDGSGLARVSPGTAGSYPAIAANRSVVLYGAADDPLGTNPDGSMEVFAVALDGTNPRQLTSGPTGTASQMPRVDDSGTWVVFNSNANLTGENSDGSGEVFLIRSDGTQLQQLSHQPIPAPGGG